MDSTVLDANLIELLVCPVSKAPLAYRRSSDELWCRVSRLAYPVRDGIPFLLEEEARELTQEEVDALAG